MNQDIKKDTTVQLYGKVAKMPKNLKASDAYNELQKIKINPNKLWYFIIENNVNVKDDGEQEIVQVIKYNPDNRLNLKEYINELKEYYKVNNDDLYTKIKNIKVVGNKDFIVIKDIPNMVINEKKLITIIVEDLIRLLYN